MTSALAMAGISKSFPGVTALDSVGLDIARGEVLAVIGENGAGKSTLMKILAGIHQPDSGTIHVESQRVQLRTPREAVDCGIAMIHQEVELVDTLDVCGNIFLGREPAWRGPARLLDFKRMERETKDLLQRIGLRVSPRMRTGDLSTAQKQMVAVARALALKAKILIMDEPTSSLTVAETERLLQIVKELRGQGASIIYISHRLAEVAVVADRVVVLRDGKNAGELQGTAIDPERMIRLMVGRDLRSFYSEARGPAAGASFELRNFRTQRYPDNEVSLAVRGGEILGLAGLVGAGRSELAQAIFGITSPRSGSVLKDGLPLTIRTARDAIQHGIYLVPEDRRELGLITTMTIRENITLPALKRYAARGLIQRQAENVETRKMCGALGVKASSTETIAENLSGGNQQKLVLAKWLSLDPKLIVFDEPTRGIDVGAKAEIYRLMRKLSEEGVAILMISSDMEEILGTSDRVAVMHDGRITGVLDRSECSQEAIMRLAVA